MCPDACSFADWNWISIESNRVSTFDCFAYTGGNDDDVRCTMYGWNGENASRASHRLTGSARNDRRAMHHRVIDSR